ncbi:N-6 DNA methylase [Nocardia cyriacigeorgica]|uniref:type I restriction-modification system subunit M/S n=1 Tax=Nocardia cyriacigeorgica TaxID=135487 RepID=UPI001895ED00|nr:type I restriction-modification system subunit M/S [Nocardia cyriacigeorgica]MBF6083367.1 N-6 DNA methylase [Nocardia cyriacigeorgica]MBF6088897.1 N-6 DNA methylase [Nocardia cyriacigeorgica]
MPSPAIRGLPVRHLRGTDIARLIGVPPSTVSNWRKRPLGFPEAELIGRQELFPVREVVEWLDGRRVLRKWLKAGEPDTTTYGDRLRRALVEQAPVLELRDIAPGAPDRLPALKTLWQRDIRARGVGEADFVDAATLLVFTWICAPARWTSIARETVERVSRRSMVGEFGVICGLIDDTLRERGVSPDAESVLVRLERADGAAIARLVDICGRLGVRGFEGLIDWYAAIAATRSDNYRTPAAVSSLLAGCAVAPKAKIASIAEPYTRFGELILALPEAMTRDPLTVDGTCSDHAAARRANMNLIVHGKAGGVWFGETRPWRRKSVEKYDAVVANPAFNIGSGAEAEAKREWKFGTPPPHNDNLAWVQSLLEMTRDGGRAAILLPAATGSSSRKREAEIRKALVQAGVVCAVIRLAAEVFPVSAVDTAVWVLRPDGAEGQPILFVDARSMVTKAAGVRPRLCDEDSLVDLVRAPETIKDKGVVGLASHGRARLVPVAEVASTGYVLVPDDYLESEREPAEIYHARIEETQRELDRQLPGPDLAARRRIETRTTTITASGLPPGWQRRRLSELCTFQAGPSPKHAPLMRITEDGTIPVIVPKNVERRRFDTENLGRTSEEATTRLSKFLTRPGDLVLVRSGKVGKCALVGPAEAGWLLSPNLTLLRVNSDTEVDPRFLLEYLLRDTATVRMESRAKVNAVASISIEALGALSIAVPPIEQQREIVDVLAPLSGDIDSLHRIVSAMEDMRTALSDGLLEGVVGVSDPVGPGGNQE